MRNYTRPSVRLLALWMVAFVILSFSMIFSQSSPTSAQAQTSTPVYERVNFQTLARYAATRSQKYVVFDGPISIHAEKSNEYLIQPADGLVYVVVDSVLPSVDDTRDVTVRGVVDGLINFTASSVIYPIPRVSHAIIVNVGDPLPTSAPVNTLSATEKLQTTTANITATASSLALTRTEQADIRTATTQAQQTSRADYLLNATSTAFTRNYNLTANAPYVGGSGLSSGGSVSQPTSAPAQPTTASNGPTALCKDGTYSYAATHQGACSHHGGVQTWYK